MDTSKVRTDGYDIVFTQSDGQTTLNYERELYDNSSGELVAWIKTDISSTTDTVFYMYYGNAGQSGDMATTTGVWDSNYAGVWHLENEITSSTTDSTMYSNNATTNVSTATTTAKMGGAIYFNGTSDIIIGDSNQSLEGFSNITLEAWVYRTGNIQSAASRIISKSNGVSSDDYYLAAYIGDYWFRITTSTKKSLDSNVSSNLYAWQHVVGVYDGSIMRIYVNGSDSGETAPAYGTLQDSNDSFTFGSHADSPSNRRFNGILDEVRISSTTRTAGWIKTEYNNQSDVSSFMTFGAEEDNTPTEFVSTICQNTAAGGDCANMDYSRLYDWEDAVECDLTPTTTRVFSGTLTGNLNENYAVELYRDGADTDIDGVVVATTSDQILVDGIANSPVDLVAQSGDQWRYNDSTSTMWTISGTTGNELGDTAIAVAKIDGTWTQADQTAVGITGWTTSATNYIKVYTTDTARHDGKWNTGAYRMQAGIQGPLLDVGESNVKIIGLQFFLTHIHPSWIIYTNSAQTGILIDKCIVRGWSDLDYGIAISGSSDGSEWTIRNTIIYNAAGVAGIWSYHSAGSDIKVYNSVIYGCATGILDNQSTITAKNCAVFNNTDDFNTGGTIDYCASDDDDGDHSVQPADWSTVFEDYTNYDFHLKSSDTDLKNAGINLYSEGISDDIDGDIRPASNWDIGADEAETPVEFVCSIMENSGDFQSLNAWESAIDCDLTASTTRVYSFDANSGTIVDGATVNVGGNSTSTLIHQASSSQILLININGSFNDNDVVCDAGCAHSVTLSNNGAPAIAVAKIDGAWSSADTQAVTILHWTTSATNYVRIYTTEAARHNGKWNDNKYRLVADASTNGAVLFIQENNVRIEGLQIEHTGDASVKNTRGIRINNGVGSELHISYTLIRYTGPGDPDNTNDLAISAHGIGGGSIFKFWNNIVWDFGNGLLDENYGTPLQSTYTVYNNTFYNSSRAGTGIKIFGITNFNLRNNLVQGFGGTCYNVNGSIFEHSNNLSDDTTSPDNAYDNKTVLFANEANDDFHLAGSDTAARDAGVDLSADSNLSFADDIDGEARGAGGAWDIGADEKKRATILNTPITDKYTAGLVGHWTFNGQDMDWGSSTAEAIDRSGQGNHGDVVNFGQQSVTGGVVGQALVFDGEDDYVKITDATDDLKAVGSDLTISAWINFDDTSTLMRGIIGNDFESGGYSFSIEDPPADDFKATLWIDSNIISIKGDTALQSNRWYHLAVVFNNSTQSGTFYLNGQNDGTKSRGASIGDGGNTFYVGVDSRDGSGFEFDGLIDEVRIYNRVLSETEIQKLYRAGARIVQLNTPITEWYTTGLVGHWTFNGPDMDWGSSTAEALDQSGQDNHGDVTNMDMKKSVTGGVVGQAMEFDGVDDYVNAGNVYDGVKTVAFWVKTDSVDDTTYFNGMLDEVRFYNRALNAGEITKLYKVGARTMQIGGYSASPISSARPSARIIDLNSTANIEVATGTITANNFIDPTIYVDGSAASTIDSDWRFVAITTNTGIDASAVDIGKVASAAWTCGETLTYCGDNYTTVQMTATYGSQCWLGENLRTIYKPDCVTGITNYCNPAGCGSPWGRLYDWDTMMNGATTATDCGAKIQGICPSGWHIPSDYTDCSSDDFPGLGTDGGALKDTGIPPWSSPNTEATNASNWTGYPAGYYSGGSYGNRATYGYFWSSAQYDASDAWTRHLYYGNAAFTKSYNDKAIGFSVRCVKD
jgi:uncharacterized protein (TIGR02145 family)